MLQFVVLLNLIFHVDRLASVAYNDEPNTGLIPSLKNDVNLDLSVDEEYEDLRAELLAYNTALSSLSDDSRRSLKSTPCWRIGGICVNFNLCISEKYLTQVPGCRDQMNVCCFAWNKFYERDQRIHDLAPPRLPWGKIKRPFGVGKGVVEVETATEQKRPRRPMKATNNLDEAITASNGEPFGNEEDEPINFGDESEKPANKTMLRSAAIIILQRRNTDK